MYGRDMNFKYKKIYNSLVVSVYITLASEIQK